MAHAYSCVTEPRRRGFISVRQGVFAVLLLLTQAGCAFEPSADRTLVPPESYREVWAEAQACTGRTGRFDDLHFFVVEGSRFEGPHGPALGYTRGKTIWIAERWIDHPMVVKHEMIHALGVDNHPRVPFAEPCKATWESWTGEARLQMGESDE